jgi:hypothetical protein
MTVFKRNLDGPMRLWLFSIALIWAFVLISDLVQYNFYWVIPNPFKDLCINLYNYLISVLGVGIDSPIYLAFIASFSCVIVIGPSTLSLLWGVLWVKRGFDHK